MAVPQAERLDLEMLAAALSQPEALQCCCGKTDCVFLKHNCSVLDSVEKDVHTAARLGQALLARHEAFMASAESERFEMQSRIEQLETDKKSLEDENARTIQENRALLDQLEALNNTVSDSETQIRSLEATLQSSEQTIRKLEAAEARAAEMEEQITNLEAEQAALQNTLVTTESEARSAMHRWRKAERGISDLQEKLEKMEREAREERDRHAEVLGRMERQRAMEKDLNTAAGRLKGAAAAKTLTDGKDGGTVVSHFVRDLLQDNANLQLGMAELRELLMNSNDEIQSLREQLLFHQPVDDGEASTTSTLRTELGPEEMEPTSPKSPRSPSRPQPKTSLSQELHIHHHYHVTRPAEPKKPKKKRQTPNSITARPFSPSSPPSPGRGPPHWRLQHTPAAPSFISHSVKDSMSTAPSTRWSVFSEQPSDFAPSSAPSSPTSNRRPSIFDRGGYETSYPVSPVTTADPVSPRWTRHHKKQPSDASRRQFSTPRPLFLGGLPEDNLGISGVPGNKMTSRPTVLATAADNIPDLITTAASSEESATVSLDSSDALPSMPLTPSFDDSFASSPPPRLHRVTSQESIMSLSGGLDIHTLKSRPSQLTLRPLGAATADTGLSNVIARPTIARGWTEGKRGSLVLRDNLLSIPDLLEGGRSASATLPSTLTAPSEGQQRSSSSSGLGKLVGWRPWSSNNSKQPDDSSSTPTSDRSRSRSPNQTSTASPGSSIIEISRSQSSGSPKPKPLKEAAFSPRSFGINQPGAIPGFQKYLAFHQRRGPPSKVVPDVVDTEALREGLAE
ncbi:hypothetical protein VP1G_02826 [Cytospora mali]|uniref:Uncharacterized protein n=1 Tax=Cytospora mali TaxID=578113 RepID=A0A194UUW6_CYTMA|nr:hypothetical protein VP1G_02826 [Valsa mali var. pyri (nom. inval.)]